MLHIWLLGCLPSISLWPRLTMKETSCCRAKLIATDVLQCIYLVTYFHAGSSTCNPLTLLSYRPCKNRTGWSISSARRGKAIPERRRNGESILSGCRLIGRARLLMNVVRRWQQPLEWELSVVLNLPATHTHRANAMKPSPLREAGALSSTVKPWGGSRQLRPTSDFYFLFI